MGAAWMAALVLASGLLLAVVAYGVGLERGRAAERERLRAEVARLQDEVDRERCRAEYAEGHADMLEKGFDPRLALAEQHVLRLKRGDFTEEEFQNLCHNFTPGDRERFRRGCEEYQRKLFGESP